MTTLTFTQFRCIAETNPRPNVSPELNYILDQLNHTIKNTPMIERIPSYVAHPSPYLTKPHPPIKQHAIHTGTDTDFKRTISLTQISSVQKDVNAIRILINKMTPGEQYPSTSTQCIDQLKQVVSYYKTHFHWKTTEKDLVEVIYSSCIVSDLYSEMYADFFTKIQTEIPELRIYEYAMEQKDIYLNEFICTEMISSENYDAFCIMNKRNDLRKQTSVFFTHLFKRGVFTPEQMVDLIYRELCLLQEFAIAPDKSNEMELLADNVSILIMHTQSRLSRVLEDTWFDQITPLVYTIADQLYGPTAQKKSDRLVFAWKRLIEIIEA